MRKILLTMHTGYAGMDSHEAYLVPDDVSNDELDSWAYWKAVDHAESYGIYPSSLEDDEDISSTYSGDNIDGDWRLFEEKDSGKVLYGANQDISWNRY